MPDNIPLSEWSGSGATRELTSVIKEFNAETSRQTNTIIQLTWAMFALALASLLASGVQIFLTLRQMGWI